MLNWNLIRDMEHLRKEMDEIFRGAGFGQALDSAFLPGVGTRRYPRINVREDADNFYLEALLPGVDGKDLDMNVVGSTLTLSGERKALDDNGGKTWHRRERGAGKFLRTVELPMEIETGKVSADYGQGVLMVTLPKAEAAKPKRIAIQVR
jgi:HSP20 family protein